MKSRKLWIGMMVVLAITLAATPAVHAQDLPKIDVDIHTNDGGGDWYKNPVIVGGGIALLFLLAILAGRGGGTTVVKS